jgi:hypothetical protein
MVVIPSPTSLLAQFGFSGAAAPAGVLYSFSNVLANIGWLLIVRTALKPDSLAKKGEAAQEEIEIGGKRVGLLLLSIWHALCRLYGFHEP